jgi:hypothetical protein
MPKKHACLFHSIMYCYWLERRFKNKCNNVKIKKMKTKVQKFKSMIPIPKAEWHSTLLGRTYRGRDSPFRNLPSNTVAQFSKQFIKT